MPVRSPEVVVTITAAIETGYECAECGAIERETLGEPLYECGECGEVFNRGETEYGNHKCPSCGRFGSKLADDCCASCEHGEVEEIDVVECPICSTLMAADDLESHILGGCR